MKIGFSTASFHKLAQLHTKEVVDFCNELNLPVIELSAANPERIEWLKKITKKDLQNFSFVSVHGPAQEDVKHLNSLEQKNILKIFEDLHKKLNFNIILFHPAEWLGDYSILQDYDFPVSIENMDYMHKVGTTPKSIEKLLAKGNFKMTLDLNHCYTHDKSMKLAHDFYKKFKNKITHYHLSDFNGAKQRHQPFFKVKHNIILENIPNLNLPIILEESLNSKEEAKEELKYLHKVTSNK